MSDFAKTGGTTGRLAWPAWLACFLLPVAITVGAAALSGVYPFGDTSFVTWDEKYQYVDFFAWLKRVMVGEASLFYTFSEGLGSNAWGLFGYYLCSPFNLILVFFDADHLEDFLFVATTLKVACAAPAMAFYLARRHGTGEVATTVLAVGYACSAWTMSQFSNLMWLDAVVVLPFVLLGCYAFIARGRWRMLVLATAAAVVTCWYTAYMIIIFAALYVVFELYLRHVETAPVKPREVAGLAARYAGCMALALALSAATFLPTVSAMLTSDDGLESRSIFTRIVIACEKLGFSVSETAAMAICAALAVAVALLVAFLLSKRVPVRVRIAVLAVAVAGFAAVTARFLSNCTFGGVLAGLSPFGYEAWTTFPAYCGVVPLALVVPYLAARGVPSKEKVAVAVLAGVMLASCLNILLYCVWCGMRAPGGFYSRTAFLALVPLLFMAARGWRAAEERRVDVRWVAGGFALPALCIVGAFALGRLEPVPAALGLAVDLVAACAFFAGVAGEGRALGRFAASGLVFLAAVELAGSGAVAWQSTHSASYTHDYHVSYAASARAQADALAAYDGSAYRVDKSYTRADASALSESMAVGYNALSSYTSAHNGRALALLNACGYGDQDEFSTEYLGAVALSDSLFGVKYTYSLGDQAGYDAVDDGGLASAGAVVWENPNALPLAYKVADGMADTHLLAERNPFAQQNALASSVLGREVEPYRAVAAEARVDEDGTVWYTVEAPAGSYLYMYVRGEMGRSDGDVCAVSIDGDAGHRDCYEFSHNVLLVSDALDQPSTHTVEMSVAGTVESPVECIFYAIAESDVAAVADEVRAGAADVTAFEDGYVEATVASDGASTLMLTIPDDEGWEVTVNGKPVETEGAYDGALMLVPLEAGENHVVARFTPPGLYAGVAVSVVALAAFLALAAVSRRRARSREGARR